MPPNKLRDNLGTLAAARELMASEPQRFPSITAAFAEARRREDGETAPGGVRMSEPSMPPRRRDTPPLTREELVARAVELAEQTGERLSDALRTIGLAEADRMRQADEVYFAEGNRRGRERHAEIAALAEATLRQEVPPEGESPSQRYERVKRAVLEAARVHAQ